MGLVLRTQPRTNTFIQQDVLGVESLKLRVFRSADFLRNEVIRSQVQREADNTNRTHPQARHRDEEHEEVQPALVGESNPENLRPETVCCHHRIRLLRLRRLKRTERIRILVILEQRVLYSCTVNCTEQRTTQDAGNTHHVEGVERPVVEALQEQQEAENRSHTEARREEPGRLTQGVHQEHRHKHRNRATEGNCVVRTDADQTRNLELTQHEANQSEGAMERNERPQATNLAPANEVTLSFGAPQQQQGVPHAVGGSRNCNGKEVAAF